MTKSFDNKLHRFKTVAPNTFRIPISLIRCSATNDDKPNKPMQEIKIASTVKKRASLPIRASSLNFLAYSSSTNLYSNGKEGFCFRKTLEISDNDLFTPISGFNLKETVT